MNIPEFILGELDTFFANGTLTKVQFSKEIGISRQQLHNIMHRKYKLRGARLKRVIWALEKYGHPLPEEL
jgi:hypothetical protein